MKEDSRQGRANPNKRASISSGLATKQECAELISQEKTLDKEQKKRTRGGTELESFSARLNLLSK